MNKFGGINDTTEGWTSDALNNRIYKLWYGMIRRCNDAKQVNRRNGRSYADCFVCDEWMSLSRFAEDIKTVPGYEQWEKVDGMELDKDLLGNGEKVYSAKTCCFIPAKVNMAIMLKSNPGITESANEANKVRYGLMNEKEYLEFDSEKEACEYLGVVKCSVASSYRRGCKCKGYTVLRIGARMEKE